MEENEIKNEIRAEKIRRALRLYAVTDRRWLGSLTLARQAEMALRGGATMLQLREKSLDSGALMQEALGLLPLCRKFGVPLIINDDAELALKSGADGVHLGQDDMDAAEARKLLGPQMIIGVSAHDEDEARAAEEAGADYIGVGAAFPTGTKADASALSPQKIARVCAAVKIPAVAIGGITADNALELKGLGLAGIAAVSAIFAQKDVENAARKMLRLAQEICGRN